MGAVGGQTPLCYEVVPTKISCVPQGFKKNCTREFCPSNIVVTLDFNVIDPNGASYASSPTPCMAACMQMCGGNYNYTTGCSGP
jgi:hypothetical protein